MAYTSDSVNYSSYQVQPDISDIYMKYIDYHANPIIKPLWWEGIVADPTFLPPDKTPDNKWHMFVHTYWGVAHLISSDGIKWRRNWGFKKLFYYRPFLFKHRKLYYLTFEKGADILRTNSALQIMSSSNLYLWSKATTILTPTLSWQEKRIGNPCLLWDQNHFKLYFSAGRFFTRFHSYVEPKYIGLATAKDIYGPYTTYKSPLIKPDPRDPYSHLAFGGLRGYKINDKYIGFVNGIYKTSGESYSRSAIKYITSLDGIRWHGIGSKPFMLPTNGWKRTHVYMLDMRKYQGKWYCYYNGRDGWNFARECIGHCRVKLHL